MKKFIISLVLALACCLGVSQAQAPYKNVCAGCVGIFCYDSGGNYCTCQIVVIGRTATCMNIGGCIPGYGCIDAKQHPETATAEQKTMCADPKPVNNAVLVQHPWIKAPQTLLTMLSNHSYIPESSDLVAGLGKVIVEKGLTSRYALQQASQVNGKVDKPSKVEDLHLSRLVALYAVLNGDTWTLEFYTDNGLEGETKYKSIYEMQNAGVTPTETLRLKGNQYVFLDSNKIEYSGTF
jgi:hypothetical protein